MTSTGSLPTFFSTNVAVTNSPRNTVSGTFSSRVNTVDSAVSSIKPAASVGSAMPPNSPPWPQPNGLPPGATCGSGEWISDVRLWSSNRNTALQGYGCSAVAKPMTSPVWFMIVGPIATVWTSCLGWKRLKAWPASCTSVRMNAAGTSPSFLPARRYLDERVVGERRIVEADDALAVRLLVVEHHPERRALSRPDQHPEAPARLWTSAIDGWRSAVCSSAVVSCASSGMSVSLIVAGQSQPAVA